GEARAARAGFRVSDGTRAAIVPRPATDPYDMPVYYRLTAGVFQHAFSMTYTSSKKISEISASFDPARAYGGWQG
ncbi:MAG: hypothetical protein ACE15D_19255, partial [Candidatus Eisenbacteria bacterium]